MPFCSHRCGYCDFATAAVGDRRRADREAAYDRYTAALVTDLARQVAAGPAAHAPPGAGLDGAGRRSRRCSSVAGPRRCSAGARLARVLAAVRAELDVAADAEITVECNPETATPGAVRRARAAGVTRISMGAQSFAPHVLATLERQHTPPTGRSGRRARRGRPGSPRSRST